MNWNRFYACSFSWKLTAIKLLLTEPLPFDAELKCSITSQLDFFGVMVVVWVGFTGDCSGCTCSSSEICGVRVWRRDVERRAMPLRVFTSFSCVNKSKSVCKSDAHCEHNDDDAVSIVKLSIKKTRTKRIFIKNVKVQFVCVRRVFTNDMLTNIESIFVSSMRFHREFSERHDTTSSLEHFYSRRFHAVVGGSSDSLSRRTHSVCKPLQHVSMPIRYFAFVKWKRQKVSVPLWSVDYRAGIIACSNLSFDSQMNMICTLDVMLTSFIRFRLFFFVVSSPERFVCSFVRPFPRRSVETIHVWIDEESRCDATAKQNKKQQIRFNVLDFHNRMGYSIVRILFFHLRSSDWNSTMSECRLRRGPSLIATNMSDIWKLIAKEIYVIASLANSRMRIELFSLFVFRIA